VRLLVVEDDDAIALPLVEGLERAGFVVRRTATGTDTLRVVDRADLVCYSISGFRTSTDQSCADGSEPSMTCRSSSSAPAPTRTVKVLCFELAVDDYVVKPFGMTELTARVRAVARRAIGGVDMVDPQHLGILQIDRRTRRVSVGEVEVALSTKEFDLLSLLGQEPGAAVSRQQIMNEVWDPHWYGPTETLDAHVASLRKKLGPALDRNGPQRRVPTS
jgi:DNA-binding response OmpR family regulator